MLNVLFVVFFFLLLAFVCFWVFFFCEINRLLHERKYVRVSTLADVIDGSNVVSSTTISSKELKQKLIEEQLKSELTTLATTIRSLEKC